MLCTDSLVPEDQGRTPITRVHGFEFARPRGQGRVGRSRHVIGRRIAVWAGEPRGSIPSPEKREGARRKAGVRVTVSSVAALAGCATAGAAWTPERNTG